MSKINVNVITNKNENGPVELSYGAIVPSGKTFNILSGASFSGVVTATSFVGDGSNLTGILGAPSTVSKFFAMRLIFDTTAYRS